QTVADAAGVSRSTVSTAYNRPDQLSTDLRDRILATARGLGYAGPDAAARSLRSGRAGALGVLFTETLSYALSDPYAVEFIRGLASVAEAHATGLLLVPLDEVDIEAGCTATRQAVVDGFCLECVEEDSPVMDVILGRGLPLVSTTRPVHRDLPSVSIDECAAARAAAGHLANLGHRRVVIVVDGRPPFEAQGFQPLQRAVDEAVDQNSAHRLLGFCDGLPDADIEVVAAGRNSREHGREAGALILDRQDRPTAVLTVSDVLALGVLDALGQRGLVPGKDVSVVGFDDIAAAADARLTTVHQPVFEKGRRAGQLLLEPEDATETAVTLPTELIVRASTGPVPT
ncbi:MAG: LacI family DNA-binding transcriptional regulator, partial [Nocardioidaceae bacterium]